MLSSSFLVGFQCLLQHFNKELPFASGDLTNALVKFRAHSCRELNRPTGAAKCTAVNTACHCMACAGPLGSRYFLTGLGLSGLWRASIARCPRLGCKVGACFLDRWRGTQA
jgi:hypothetical protein